MFGPFLVHVLPGELKVLVTIIAVRGQIAMYMRMDLATSGMRQEVP